MVAYPELKKRIPESEEMEGEEATQYLKSHKSYKKNPEGSYFIVTKDLFKRINIKKTCKILDIGCGYGGFIEQINKLKPNLFLVGIDSSKDMIKLANKTSKRKNTKFYVQKADKLNFKNESFDVLICKDTFHHFSNPVKVLKELYRVLKKGGKIYLLDLKRNSKKKIITNVIDGLSKVNLTNTQQYIASLRASYTIPEIKNLLKKAKIKKSKVVNGTINKRFSKKEKLNKKTLRTLENYMNGHWIAIISK